MKKKRKQSQYAKNIFFDIFIHHKTSQKHPKKSKRIDTSQKKPPPPTHNAFLKKHHPKSKKMSGTQMIFQLNHPIQLLNTTETIEITATFIASLS